MRAKGRPSRVRNLTLVLGDQLDRSGSGFNGFDPAADAVLMLEVRAEAVYVPQHKQRLVLFFSAMRHFRDALESSGVDVRYSLFHDHENTGAIESELGRHLSEDPPERLVLSEPGDYRVLGEVRRACAKTGVELELRSDSHFLLAREDFADYAESRKALLMESFYRWMRRRTGVLMEGTEPLGGRWNFDSDNREAFRKGQRPKLPVPLRFEPDAVTREVMGEVQRHFPNSPGRLEGFAHPVSATDAQAALRDFVERRLPQFGRYQDAMLTGEPFLYHSLLSVPLNLHLLNPRTALRAAEEAFESDRAPLNSVEGFVRQILGWREYIRGLYWWRMPDYASLNALDARLPMPTFMWSGETDMRCVRVSVHQLQSTAYAHHIQRLMILGQFALLLGVDPYQAHLWHLSMHIDAVDWVSLPNVLGMSQYADGGVLATKPYCASGNYVNRMSDYCKGCRYDPRTAHGDTACPFTALYWDFLERNQEHLHQNRRMRLQYRNLERKDRVEREAIRATAHGYQVEFTRQCGPPAE